MAGQRHHYNTKRPHSALGYTFMLTCVTIQLSVLCQGFFGHLHAGDLFEDRSIAESCAASADCTFTAGDSSSCGTGCDYTAPVVAVAEACAATPGANEYESTPATATSNRACTALTSCGADNNLDVGQAATATAAQISNSNNSRNNSRYSTRNSSSNSSSKRNPYPKNLLITQSAL